MKKNILVKTTAVAVMVMCGFSLTAQMTKLPVGKKFSLATTTEMSTSMSIMGQDMKVDNKTTNYSDLEVKKVSDNGITYTNTVKRMKLMLNTTGMEQGFDTDDPSTTTDPQLASVISTLKKPFDAVIENNKTTFTGEMNELQMQSGVPGVATDFSKLVLSQANLDKLKDGYHWSDSLIAEGSKVVNDYTVLKKTETTAEILVQTKLDIDVTIKQMGMEIKESLKGTTNSRRQYAMATGLLIKEDSDLAIDGIMDVMGQKAPVSMKGKAVTTITQ